MPDISVNHELLNTCESFLQEYEEVAETYLEQYPKTTVLEVPFEYMQAFSESLEDNWRNYPEEVTAHLAEALNVFVAEDDEDLAGAPGSTSVRIQGYDPHRVYDVGQYRPDDVAGRLIHIRGQVTKRSKRKLRDEVVAFECQRCGRLIRIPQTKKKLQQPHECSGCERQGPFEVNDRQTKMRDFQHIRLQTLPEESERGDTEMIDMQVYDDLVGELNPGDRAVLNVEMVARRVSDDSLERELEGSVRGVEKQTGDHTDVDIEPHEDDIEEVVEADNTYEQVFESVAPFHEGDEMVKKAVALQLFGGVEKQLDDGTWFRGNSHVLLMGDPGSGKTKILKYVTNLVPRSEYATGKSTSAGLTATAQKDEFADGGWTLQAGTLVKASGGLAAIDELDKMRDDDITGFMEALSDQQVTVTMVVSGVLPAKTAVLAAANPKFGTFDPMADIGQQLDLNEVLLSRFDLWFIMKDEPDEELDEAIARTQTEAARVGQKTEAGIDLTPEEVEKTNPPIPPEMFRAYVALAKQHFPVFTDDAMDLIVSSYVELRQVNEESDGPVPATARMVEALHRLSEASARITFSDEVTTDDVQRALDILYESLETLGVDPDTGKLDATRFETGSSSSKKDRMKALLGIINGKESDDEPATREEVKEEAMVLMDEDQFEETMDALDRADDIYHPDGPGSIRTL